MRVIILVLETERKRFLKQIGRKKKTWRKKTTRLAAIIVMSFTLHLIEKVVLRLWGIEKQNLFAVDDQWTVTNAFGMPDCRCLIPMAYFLSEKTNRKRISKCICNRLIYSCLFTNFYQIFQCRRGSYLTIEIKKGPPNLSPGLLNVEKMSFQLVDHRDTTQKPNDLRRLAFKWGLSISLRVHIAAKLNQINRYAERITAKKEETRTSIAISTRLSSPLFISMCVLLIYFAFALCFVIISNVFIRIVVL